MLGRGRHREGEIGGNMGGDGGGYWVVRVEKTCFLFFLVKNYQYNQPSSKISSLMVCKETYVAFNNKILYLCKAES